MNILAIDPGKFHAGAAVFHGDDLIAAKLLRSSSKNPAQAAREIGEQAQDLSLLCGKPLDKVWCEEPNVRARNRQKGDPNDLLYLMLTNGAVFATVTAHDHELVPVNDWKGSVPKAIMIGRITGHWGEERLLAPPPPKLRSEELQLLGPTPSHNVVDAIGIGLWAVHRL